MPERRPRTRKPETEPTPEDHRDPPDPPVPGPDGPDGDGESDPDGEGKSGAPPPTAPPPPPADTDVLDRLAQVSEQLKIVTAELTAMKTVQADQHQFLSLINQERNAYIEAVQKGQAAPGQPPSMPPQLPVGVSAPSAAGGQTVFNDPNAAKAADAMKLMTQAAEAFGSGPPTAAVADTFRDRLAEATLSRLTSEKGLMDAIVDRLKGKMADTVAGGVVRSLPTFE